MRNCQHFREYSGLSISELAKHSGVSRDLIYKIEAGEAVRVEKLHAIAKVFEDRCKKPFVRESEITKARKSAS